MKILKSKYFKIENIFVFLILLSSFSIGGENLYFKYSVIVFAFFILFYKQKILYSSFDLSIFIAGIIYFIYNIIIQNFNSSTLNFLIILFVLLIIKNLKIEKTFFVNIFILSTIIHSLIIFYQFYIKHISRTPSTFVNANWAALWISIGLYFFIFEKNLFKKNKILRIFLFVIFLFTLILTFSRTLIFIIIIFIIYGSYKFGNKKILKYLVIFLIVISAGIILIRINISENQLTWSRLKIYKADFKMFLDSPVTGHGIKNVEDLLPNYFEGEFNGATFFSKSPKMSHSIYFEILLEFGVIGLFIFLLFLIKKYKNNYYKIPFIIFLVFGLFNNIEKSFSLLILFAIIMSFNLKKKKIIKFRKEVFFILLLIITYIYSFKLFSFIKVHQGYKQFENKKYIKAYKSYQTAHNFTKYDSFYTYTYLRYILDLPQNDILGFEWDERFYKIQSLFDNLKIYDKYTPKVYNLETYYYLKILRSEKFGNLKKEVYKLALNSINKAIDLNKNNALFYYKKMILFFVNNQKEKAFHTGKTILKIEPNFLRVHELMIDCTNNKKIIQKHKKRIKEIKNLNLEGIKLNKYDRNILQK